MQVLPTDATRHSLHPQESESLSLCVEMYMYAHEFLQSPNCASLPLRGCPLLPSFGPWLPSWMFFSLFPEKDEKMSLLNDPSMLQRNLPFYRNQSFPPKEPLSYCSILDVGGAGLGVMGFSKDS